MKIDLADTIVGLDGNVVLEQDAPLTLQTVCLRAMVANLPADTSRTLADVTRDYALAMKLQQAEGVINLTPEEVTKLRERVAKTFILEVAGYALRKLDGNSND